MSAKVPKGSRSTGVPARCGVMTPLIERLRFVLSMVTLAFGLTLLALPADADSTGAAQGAMPGLFGMQEVRAANLAPFPKWTGVLSRFQSEIAEDETCASAERCDHERWRRFIASLEGRKPIDQIRAVNREFNRHRYVLDPVNYGVPDYWATPFQFIRLDGDCEDYAIAKFMALRALGFENEMLRVVVLRDLNLKLAHAILVVYHEGRIFVLDNQISDIVETSAIRHYRPIYSVNESAWWLHRQ